MSSERAEFVFWVFVIGAYTYLIGAVLVFGWGPHL